MKDKLYYYKARVGRIIDGDTFTLEEIDLGFGLKMKRHGLDEIKVRLYTADTFELRDKDPSKKQLAYEARDYMIGRLEGQEVFIRSVEFDNFGRILAHVWIGDEMINETLIKEGLAVIYKD